MRFEVGHHAVLARGRNVQPLMGRCVTVESIYFDLDRGYRYRIVGNDDQGFSRGGYVGESDIDPISHNIGDTVLYTGEGHSWVNRFLAPNTSVEITSFYQGDVSCPMYGNRCIVVRNRTFFCMVPMSLLLPVESHCIEAKLRIGDRVVHNRATAVVVKLIGRSTVKVKYDFDGVVLPVSRKEIQGIPDSKPAVAAKTKRRIRL